MDFDLEFMRACGVPPARLAETAVLDRLYDDLAAANEVTNLTRVIGPAEYALLHVLDSLLVGRAVPELITDALLVADVGCGAGFPLLPLAWANPRLRLVGIESRGKKVAFLQREIAALGLASASAVTLRAREAAHLPQHAGKYDVVLLRAVGPAERMLKECRGLLSEAPQAKIVFYKTPAAIEEELPLALREAEKFRLKLDTSDVFDLPESAGKRQFLLAHR